MQLLLMVRNRLELRETYAYVGHDNASVTGNSSTAREMNSFSQYINADVTTITDSDASSGGNQAGPITEANLLTCSEALYNHGGNPTMLAWFLQVKLKLLQLLQLQQVEKEDFGTGTTLVNVVDVMVTPYNQMKLVLNRHMLTDRGIPNQPNLCFEVWFLDLLLEHY